MYIVFVRECSRVVVFPDVVIVGGGGSDGDMVVVLVLVGDFMFIFYI